MIDGVKILCNLNPSDWTSNKNLSFRSWADLSTGEIPHDSKHADLKGIHLSIISGNTGTFCNLRGSLPKYFNNGENNAFDYDYSDFLTTCDLLRDDLKINPKEAVLRGFEFGVNINLPFDISAIYEAVKSFKMNICGINKVEGKRNGVRFDFQQYEIKIYDKGQQQTGKKSRLMRFEIVVKKMAFVKSLGIKTLADLQNTRVWVELSKILLKVWAEIIFIDKLLRYKLMSNHQQKKYLRFFDIHYWANLNRNTYYKAKNDLNKLQTLYEGKHNAKQIIYTLIAEKCQKLTTLSSAEIGDNLTKLQGQNNTQENVKNATPLEKSFWRQFNHLDKGLNTGNIYTPNLSSNNIKNNTLKSNTNLSKKNISKSYITNSKKNKNTHAQKYNSKKNICMNCKKELKNKKASAKFCGLRCKNHYNGKRRTKERQKQRATEVRELKKLLPKLKALNLPLLVIYKADGAQYADHLQQSEINAPAEWIRQVVKILIMDEKSTPPVCFTTLRAKQLIREITNINNQKL